MHETDCTRSGQVDSLHFSIHDQAAGDDTAACAAWTEIEAGRFMPRRVRGSFQGRALG